MSDPIPMRHLQGGWAVLHGKCKHCGELIMRFRFKEGQQWWWHTDFATGKTYRLCTKTALHPQCSFPATSTGEADDD